MAFSPVKQAAMALSFEILQPERASDTRFCELMRSKEPDLFIVVAFGQILKKALLDIPRWGALNIHASLLPKYRGAAPIQGVILNNESKTGLTAMIMDEGMDTGPVLLQEELAINRNDTAGMLHDQLAQLSGDFLIKTLTLMSKGRLRKSSQDDTKATYAPKIERNMSQVNWTQSAESISALIRALDPWPGAYTTFSGHDIKLFRSQVVSPHDSKTVPGRISVSKMGSLLVETGKGIVEVRELQISGKKRLLVEDFLRGFPLEKGAVFGA